MGAGKTTVGQRCARAARPAVRRHRRRRRRDRGMTVTEIFERHGEARFRELERGAVADVCASPEPLVIACGGGAVLDADNRQAAARARASWCGCRRRPRCSARAWATAPRGRCSRDGSVATLERLARRARARVRRCGRCRRRHRGSHRRRGRRRRDRGVAVVERVSVAARGRALRRRRSAPARSRELAARARRPPSGRRRHASRRRRYVGAPLGEQLPWPHTCSWATARTRSRSRTVDELCREFAQLGPAARRCHRRARRRRGGRHRGVRRRGLLPRRRGRAGPDHAARAGRRRDRRQDRGQPARGQEPGRRVPPADRGRSPTSPRSRRCRPRVPRRAR